jgi:hypothetical protein
MTPATPTEYGFDCTWGVELVAQDVGRWLLGRHITPWIGDEPLGEPDTLIMEAVQQHLDAYVGPELTAPCSRARGVGRSAGPLPEADPPPRGQPGRRSGRGLTPWSHDVETMVWN